MTSEDFVCIWAEGGELSELGKRHMAEKIDAAIAAAVAEEREQCAKVAEGREKRYMAHDMFPAYGMDGLASEAHDIAAAIRARNGAGK